jgi:formate hydrogenlyase transcriptional activator
MIQQDTTALKYSALSEMCRSISLRRELREIIADLAQHISPLLPFHYVSVLLHDPERNVMRVHVLHCPAPRSEWLGEEFAVDGSPAGMAWQTQKAVNCHDVEGEKRFPEVSGLLYDRAVRSFCVVPLTAADSRLGGLLFGRRERGGFDEDEIEFAKLVATQVALAVENGLHQEHSAALQRELARERDRLQLVLELNNAVVSNLDLRDLFSALSSNLRRVIEYDFASLLISNGDHSVRVHALDFPGGRGFLQPEMTFSISEPPLSTAFESGKAILVGDGAVPFSVNPGFSKIRTGEGFRSALIVPLRTNGCTVGLLNLGSRHQSAFTQGDLEFATQIGQQVAIAVSNALQHYALSESKQQISEQKSYLEEEIRAEQDFEDIVGYSRALRAVLEQVDTVAPTDSTVLICGETGTGKELIARAIHERSTRRPRTFVRINCAAIPLGLLESELFGHEKGAFTGAITRKVGRFELAHQGSLFLDEVGDIPLELQPKLLRVLQEQEFERLGSSSTQRVDVRIIAASNRNLSTMAADGKFRTDLYYRLNVFPINVPPLRERAEDIPLLARYFVAKYARRMHKRIVRIPVPTIEALTNYSWPGNVRELQNFLERAVILTAGPDLRAPLSELGSTYNAAPLATPANDSGGTLREMEKSHILSALRQSNWVIGGPTGAAARLGLKRTTLLYRMAKLGIARGRQAPPVSDIRQ